MKAASLLTALVAARRAAGLTQRQLAARLGRTRSFVGKIETGRRQVTVIEFCEISKACGTDPPDVLAKILNGEGSPCQIPWPTSWKGSSAASRL